MCAYIFSLGAGVLVGIVYGFLNIRSPAQPVVPLVGLFGMLLASAMPMGKRHFPGWLLPWSPMRQQNALMKAGSRALSYDLSRRNGAG